MKLELFKSLKINLIFSLFIFLFFSKCANKRVKNLPKVIKDGMVMIPSGDFLMGSNDETIKR
jgi:formylglycine-generating enzyme required for sulfatase activity